MVGGLPHGGVAPLPPEAVLTPLRLLLVAGGLGAAAWLQGPVGEATAARRRSDFRYTPDPRVLRIVAGAHRSTVADVLWLRTLPDMSREFSDPVMKARWMHSALACVTDLEPTFLTVYDFGYAYLTVLGRSAPGAVDHAIELLEKGVRENPESAGLHVRLAMVHYMERKDRQKAVELLRRAAVLPGIDSLSLAMLATLEAEGREDLLAVSSWLDVLRSENAEMRRIAELNLLRVKLQIALRAAREFRTKRGRAPASLDELRDPELIQAEVIELVLEGVELLPDARVRSARLEEMEREEVVLGTEKWARTFRDEVGRWPTLDDARAARISPPSPPAGKAWRFDGGNLVLVDAPR